MSQYSKEILELVPPNFSLASYEGSETCDLKQWDNNLHRRVLTKTLLGRLKVQEDRHNNRNEPEKTNLKLSLK